MEQDDSGAPTRQAAVALHQRGLAAAAAGDLSGAIRLIEAALDSDPDARVAYANLGNLLRATGQPEQALRVYRAARARAPHDREIGRQLLLTLLYQPGLDPAARFAEHGAYAARHLPPVSDRLPPPANPPDPERTLRVGILSSDLRDHPVARNLLTVFLHHDRRATELICYAELAAADPITARFRQHSAGWRSTVGLSDRAVAEMMRADRIDLLVVCAGHFDMNRPLVAAYRPAPLQLSMYDGATSGLPEMDYWVGDPVLTPAGSSELFTERVVRLPVLWSYLPRDYPAAVGPLPARANGFVTFGCFSRMSKLSDAAIALWGAVLRALPTARLALKYGAYFDDAGLRAQVLAACGAHGIAPTRIAFLPGDALAYLDAYGLVDIMLDTTPFSGATMTFDALSMGVPVLTVPGDTALSRLAASVLAPAGLSDLIAPSADALAARALALAGDLDALAHLRASLRARVAASPLCDGPAYARSVEALWRALWREWCAGAAG